MKRLATPLALLASVVLAPAQTDVGSGPVSETVRRDFLNAYFRNGFHTLTSLPPSGDVRRLGSGGYVQEFPDAQRTAGVRYALVRSTAADTVQEGVTTTFQVYPAVYTFFSSQGVATVGYPTTDTQNCPVLTTNSCTFQTFDKNFALFAYAQATIDGSNFAVKDPFFTRWRAVGGIGSLGPASDDEETVTSAAGTAVTATRQRFFRGVIYNHTSGALSGRAIVVTQPIYDVYVANNTHAGFLGLPTSDEITVSATRRRQTFEGGVIEYDLGGTPVLRLPVSNINVSATGSGRLNLGDTIRLEATTFAANGTLLEGRTVSWISSNGRVISIEPTGTSVTARAVGGGSANITAVSEGKTSRVLTFFVTAPCCQIGEGSPSAAIERTFTDAVARTRINVKVPASNPVRRVGNGYIQELQPADATSTARFLVAKPDRLAAAYVVTGAILARSLELGGPAGALGYPIVDPTAGGRQLFENGALAGNPVQVVTGPVLTRWGQQNYELGAAGLPASPSAEVLSFTATVGAAQGFTGGSYFAHLTGAQAGRAFLVRGLILDKYLAMGAAGGSLGLPLGEEGVVSGRRRQDFEGGVADYGAGDREARVELRDRKPQISANPGTVAAGTRVRVAAGGFDTGATLRISVGGQPDFLVKAETGAFAWEIFVPANAQPGLITLRAADVNGSALAVGSYVIQSAIETLARITKVSGDVQTGFPGARLAQPLRILVRDQQSGNPLAGVPVRFNPSPGASIEGASTLTDERGEAQAYLRLPTSDLPALATAEASRQVVTFSARVAPGSIQNFPQFTQTGSVGDADLGSGAGKIGEKGSLLVAAAAMVRHLQNNRETGSPNGLAEPLPLNQYLKELCQFDPKGERVCDGFTGAPDARERNVNLWRLANFTGGNLDIAAIEAKSEAIRDALAEGTPVLVAMAMSAGGGVVGSHFVVATGVGAGGAILVHDPNPSFRRNTLDEYAAGFEAGGRQWRASLTSALRFLARATPALGFLVATSQAEPQVLSVAGACGAAFTWPETAVSASSTSGGATVARLVHCDGQQAAYQLDLGGSGEQAFALTDLGQNGGRTEARPQLPASFRVSRPDLTWVASLQETSFETSSVLNAASFRPELAPGALAAVFGTGLAVGARGIAADIDGAEASVLFSTPFQANIRIPLEAGPGPHTLRLRSPYGAAERRIELREVAPAVFRLGGLRGAILNQNGTVNAATNPAGRGQVIVIFGNGLGALDARGNLLVARTAVKVFLGERELDVQFAGEAPGFPGLNQINARIPADTPPGLDSRLVLEQNGVRSEAVLVSVQ